MLIMTTYLISHGHVTSPQTQLATLAAPVGAEVLVGADVGVRVTAGPEVGAARVGDGSGRILVGKGVGGVGEVTIGREIDCGSDCLVRTGAGATVGANAINDSVAAHPHSENKNNR